MKNHKHLILLTAISLLGVSCSNLKIKNQNKDMNIIEFKELKDYDSSKHNGFQTEKVVCNTRMSQEIFY